MFEDRQEVSSYFDHINQVKDGDETPHHVSMAPRVTEMGLLRLSGYRRIRRPKQYPIHPVGQTSILGVHFTFAKVVRGNFFRG